MPQVDDNIDFFAAEMYLAQAKKAHEDGDERLSAAACRMVAVALGLDDRSSPIIHTEHLAKK